MSVAFNAASESHTGTIGSTSQTSFSWNHYATGTPRGALVFTFNNASTDDATGVTYNGTSLTLASRAVDTAGEPGDCKAWFIGSSVPATTPSSTWTDISSGVSSGSGRNVATDNKGTWVIPTSVSNTVGVVYSSNITASSWTYYSTGLSGNPLDIATDGNGTWAVATNSGIRYTTNLAGNVWSSGLNVYCSSIIYDGTRWVAVTPGTNSVIYSSSISSTSWTTSSGTISNPSFIRRGVDGTYVIIGSGVYAYTSDITSNSWTNGGTLPSAFSGNIDNNYRIIHDGTYWIFIRGFITDVGSNSYSAIAYSTSLSSNSWQTVSTIGSLTVNSTTGQVNASLGDIATDKKNNWILCVGGLAYRTTSSNLSSWTFQSTVISINRWVGSDGSNWLVGENPFSNIASLTPKITVTRNNNANTIWAVGITVDADKATEVSTDANGILKFEGDGSGSNLSASPNDGYPGSNSLRFAGVNSGLSGVDLTTTSTSANTLVAASGSTGVHDIDYGNRVAAVVRETTAGEGPRLVGFNSSTSDDIALVTLAVRETSTNYTSNYSGWGIPIR